ncbi:MAG: hypothetical protein LBH98_00740 [Chitinispirillales bacterium]|jgi:hypothetical protein|nr:hypothetical protein [Chitinispirillales bacterium]
MGKRMWDSALTENEQEKAADDYIIGCLKCAAKHYQTIGIEDKYILVAGATAGLERKRMLQSKNDGRFYRQGDCN